MRYNFPPVGASVTLVLNIEKKLKQAFLIWSRAKRSPEGIF